MCKRSMFLLLTIIFLGTLSGCTLQPDSNAPAMEAYRKILRNELSFTEVKLKIYYSDDVMYEDSGLDGNEFTMDDYFTRLYVESGVVNPKYTLEFSMTDIDGDQIPEVIVNERPCYDKLILRYEKGVVYACLLGDKQYGEIKADGTAHWESGSYHYGVGRLRLSSQTLEHIIIAEYEQGACPDSVETYINGVSVSKEEFSAFYTAYEDKEEVVWHDLTDENIEMYVRQ